MNNLSKPSGSIAGIEKIWFIPAYNVVSVGDIILNEVQGMSIYGQWYSIYGVIGSKVYTENEKESKDGIIIDKALQIFYPEISEQVIRLLEEMKGQQFLVAFKDHNGLYRLAGTKDNPLNFTYKINTGKSISDAQGVDMEFFSKSKIGLLTGSEVAFRIVDQFVFSDWFLPSRDELLAMYNNLRAYGVGAFMDYSWYFASTEVNATDVCAVDFETGNLAEDRPKYATEHVRACRKFKASAGSYALRDRGPAGGYIFYIDGDTYYEAAPTDQYAEGDIGQQHIWSNITDVTSGAGYKQIGGGIENTLKIINQDGHTDSAAKLCDDLIITL